MNFNFPEPRERAWEIKNGTEFSKGGRIKDGTAGGGWKATAGIAGQITGRPSASDITGNTG